MSKKQSALFLSIARRCHQRGESSRALVTIINALRNRPEFVTLEPESISLLADCLRDGFEDEMNRLLMRHPQIGEALNAALIEKGREAFAQKLFRHFESYCVEQLKASQRYPSASFPVYAQENLVYFKEDAFSDAHEGSDKASFSATFSSTTQSLTSGHSGLESSPNGYLLPGLVLPTIRPRVRRADGFSSSGTRFERIRGDESALHLDIRSDIDVEHRRDKVGIEKDLAVSRRRQKPAASLTPFRSYADELEQLIQTQLIEDSSKRSSRPDEQLTPMEAVAETTHSLSDTPSVEPYCIRHPRRFVIRPASLIGSVFFCVCLAFVFIAFHNASVNFEQKALTEMGEAYFSSAQGGGLTELQRLPRNSAQALLNREFTDAYAHFIAVWESKHYLVDTAIQKGAPPNRDASLPHHAAHIMRLVMADDVKAAEAHFNSLPRKIWRKHPYFKLWSLGQIEAGKGQFLAASRRYEQLLNGPLAPFAAAAFGLLALESGRDEIQRRFLNYGPQINDKTTHLAQCARVILESGESGAHAIELKPSGRALAAPYDDYSKLALVFSVLSRERIPSHDMLEAVEAMAPLQDLENDRLAALVLGYISANDASSALVHFENLSLRQGHPKLQRLQQALVAHALHTADWGILSALSPELPTDMSYLEAAHAIDSNLAQLRSSWPARSLRISDTKGWSKDLPSNDLFVQDLKKLYVALYEGRYESAIALSLSLRNAYPSAWEPIYLLAMAHAQKGQPLEAAKILEHRAMQSPTALALMILSELYRARGGERPLKTSLLLQHLRFDDPALEAARCEILWRQGFEQATVCIENALQKPRPCQSLIVMSALDAPKRWTSQMLKKANSGGMSFPGFHKIYAEKLASEGHWRDAAKAYEKAILWDKTTADADSISKLSTLYLSRYRRYEGRKHFESLLTKAKSRRLDNATLGLLHYATAVLYNPRVAHSSALIHLRKAHELLGDDKRIMKAFINFYKKKERPQQVKKWRQRLETLVSKQTVKL